MVSAVPSQYFRRRRGFSNGIVYAGGGLGGGALALVNGALIERIGVKSMYFTYGSVVLVCCLPSAYLIRENNPTRSRQYFDVRLFRDLRFVLLGAGSAIAILPLCVGSLPKIRRDRI